MHTCAFQLAVVLNVALVASAHFAVDPSGNQEGNGIYRTEQNQPKDASNKAGMMRRETPRSTKVEAAVTVNAQGHQIAAGGASHDRQHTGADSMAQTDRFRKANKVEEKKDEKEEGIVPDEEMNQKDIKDDMPEHEKRVEIPPQSSLSTLTQQEAAYEARHGIVHQRAVDERNHHAAKLSDEDEALYSKLFPEDREDEGKAAVSALEQSGQKAFRIKVPVSGGKRLCLTEDNTGYKVRAEPCRRGSHRQKWYWMGSKLKNLYSKGRCLGLVHKKHHVSAQASAKELDSLLQGVQNMDNAKHLSMSFYCTNTQAPLGWAIDEQGRLKSVSNSQCMAINEHEDFNALVLPCEDSVSK